ncbi:MAG TPA: Ku protein [Candidatus Paceibacterota bacterium]|nr:Ku protein [Candidatus Paceibacterota bacterium]
MRSIWSGALTFGLINIPVKLYSATREKGLSFHMLHKTDLSPIRYARICRSDGREVPFEDIVKGYEYQKGDFIVLTEADFKKADVKKTKSIEITDFSESKEIDPSFYDKPYYLEPEQGAEKAYALLREALKRSGRVGIARFVLRAREHIAAVRPEGKLLILNQLRYNYEIKPANELNIPAGKNLQPKEISMALRLIDELTEPFNPKKYKDTYEAELAKVIESRLKGKKTKTKGRAPKPTKSPDLMAVLRQSLARGHKRT